MLLSSTKVTNKLGLDNDRRSLVVDAHNQCKIWLPTHTESTKSLFRGSKPLFRLEKYNPFTSMQRTELASINIIVNANTIYVGGLVSVQMKENLSPCLFLLQHQIEQQALKLWRDDTLYNILSHYCTEQQTLFTCQQPTTLQIRRSLQKLRQVQNQIGRLLLPEDFLSLLLNPNGFVTTTLYRIGIYALTFIQEIDPMFLTHINFDDNSETHTDTQQEVTLDLVDQLQEGQLLGLANTPLSFRDSKIEEPPEIHYPSLNKTKKFNNRQAIESKARTAVRVYNRIKPRLKHMTPKQKQLEVAKIRSMRPAMRTLKAYYRAKGDSNRIANMLVTPKTYPDLPQVQITKRHHQVLLDVVRGKEDLHTQFINKGFL